MSKRRVTRSNSTPSKKTKVDMDDLAVNTIRCLAADMPSAAKSGHPGEKEALHELQEVSGVVARQ
jgi:hypothetical protein